MKKYLATTALFLISMMATAQVKVEEPEFINTYCILTSDSTVQILPKENGSVEKHQTKAKSFLGGLSKVASFAGAAGAVGGVIGANSGNLTGAMTGLKTATTAMSVANAADKASGLVGAVGMDVTFNGKSSSYTIKNNGNDVRLLIKGENNEYDPMGIYRIVKFNVVGKKRRIQWMEIESSVLGTDEAKKGGYVNFTGHKYGQQSYLLTIPASELEEGQYGVFYMSIITASAIPVGTFAIK